MSDPVGRWIFIECLFVVLSVFCSLAGCAVRECSESRLTRAAEDGDKKAAKLLPVVQEPDNFCAALQVGAVGFGFFAVYNPLLRQLVGRLALLVPEGTGRNLLSAAGWIVLVLLALTLCGFAPALYAKHRPEKAAKGTFGPALLLSRLLHPLAAALLWLAGLVLRLFGVNPNAQLEDVSEDEIRLMVESGEESGAIQSEEKELIENIFEFDDITADEIMVHRTDMTVLWLEDTQPEILDTIRESGLSRFPVCGEDMDDIIGILNTRDYLLNAQKDAPAALRELLRPVYFVPESVKADVLFRDMQQKKVHMAIVVDEYGGTSGLVTMEDLLEQLVGEIYDEFDSEEEQEISHMGENLWRIAGSASLEDVAEALELPLTEEDSDEYETLGGLVFSQLSVIPRDGEQPEVEALGLHIQVQEIRSHRVEWTLVRKLPQPEPVEE